MTTCAWAGRATECASAADALLLPDDQFCHPRPVLCLRATDSSRSLHLALQNILSKVKHQAPRQDALTSVSVEMQLFRGNGHRPMASRLLLSSPPGGRLHEPSSSATYLRCSPLTLSVFIRSSPPNPLKKWNKSSVTVFE
ncbi:hypothetical protein PANDA_022395 [Ailuropoda melanoleuca]|uniref:Uncharacterized protein n=1 Tax=Ailuropoda melanoleuca TaxID=9646 RepID=D2I8H7_AILME|nr:hypothetical protein PANDA_022395 [Ailuropoda melanoleuca]